MNRQIRSLNHKSVNKLTFQIRRQKKKLLKIKWIKHISNQFRPIASFLIPQGLIPKSQRHLSAEWKAPQVVLILPTAISRQTTFWKSITISIASVANSDFLLIIFLRLDQTINLAARLQSDKLNYSRTIETLLRHFSALAKILTFLTSANRLSKIWSKKFQRIPILQNWRKRIKRERKNRAPQNRSASAAKKLKVKHPRKMIVSVQQMTLTVPIWALKRPCSNSVLTSPISSRLTINPGSFLIWSKNG